MGTNFYCGKVHIGKRSAAGPFCWDCRITLCKGGIDRIHYSSSDNDWFTACPECGKKYKKGNITEGAAGRELGFNKAPFGEKTGVASCSSFTWAVNPSLMANLTKKDKINDEYDREYSLEEFWAVLLECPVQYFHSIGNEFC